MMKRNYVLSTLAVVVAVLGFVVGILGNNIVADLFPKNLSLLGTALGTIANILISLFGIYLAGKIERRSLKEYGIYWRKKDYLHGIGGLVIGVAIFLIITLPLYLSGLYTLKSGNQDFYELAVHFIVFIAVGMTEELLFRGFIQHRLLRFGPMVALLISAFLFALVHGLNPNVSMVGLMNVFLAGCFFGAIMYLSGSLFTAIGAHITWNWTQGSLLGIPVSGTNEPGYFSTLVKEGHTLWTGDNFGAEASLSATLILALLTMGILFYLYKTKKIQRYGIDDL